MKHDYKLYKMFKHGCKFLDCAIMCQGVQELREHFDAKVPEIVNMAFACEVFLKTLIVLDGKEQRGHQIKVLWDALDTENRVAIVERIIDGTNVKEEEIAERIDDISNSFTEWRYLYEVPGLSVHIGFLEKFTLILRDIVCEKLYKMTYVEYKMH